MPLYTIIAEAQVTLEETWTVEAASEEEAHEALYAGNAELVSERHLDDEHNRTITYVSEAEQ